MWSIIRTDYPKLYAIFSFKYHNQSDYLTISNCWTTNKSLSNKN